MHIDGLVLISISIISLSAVAALPVLDGQSQSFVPGVFISNDMLKDLQDKADQNPKTTHNISGSDSAATNLNEALRSYNGKQLKVNQGYQSNSSPLESQPIITNQPQPTLTQVISSQQVPANQPAVVIAQAPATNPQPTIFVSQQPSNTQQQMVVSQQPINSQQPLVIAQQPSQQLLFSAQSTGGQQPIVIAQAQQPNVPNQQPILVSQQPNQQPILITQAIQQPNVASQQTLVGQPQNQQTFVLQNGQMLTSAGQPAFAANPGTGNQVTLVTRPNQNQNSVYSLVPMNSQNTLANSNSGNGNTYLVPVQNVPQLQGNQIYTLSAGK